MRLLIVDECELSAGMLAVVLQIYGHEVRLIRNLGGAVRVAANFQPEIVLLSVSAPVTSTEREVAQEIRNSCAGEEPQIFALCGTPSALSDDEHSFFDHVFPRPVRFGQIKPFLETPAPLVHLVGQRAYTT